MPRPTLSTSARSITLAELRAGAAVPITVPVGDAGYHDYGNEPLPERVRADLLAVADGHGWPDATTLHIGIPGNSWPLVGFDLPDLTAHDGPLHTSMWWDGYRFQVQEPGCDPRPVGWWVRHGVLVGRTDAERKAELEAWWSQRREQLPADTRALLRLSELGRARARLRAQDAEVGDELRAEVLAALEAGVPVARIAEATRLSVARIYQVRDGRR